MSLSMLVAMWLDNSLLNDTFDNDMLPTAQVQVEEKEKPSEPLSDRAASQLEKLSQQAPPHVTYSEARAAVSATGAMRTVFCYRSEQQYKAYQVVRMLETYPWYDGELIALCNLDDAVAVDEWMDRQFGDDVPDEPFLVNLYKHSRGHVTFDRDMIVANGLTSPQYVDWLAARKRELRPRRATVSRPTNWQPSQTQRTRAARRFNRSW